jgi:hypothetical protein
MHDSDTTNSVYTLTLSFRGSIVLGFGYSDIWDSTKVYQAGPDCPIVSSTDFEGWLLECISCRLPLAPSKYRSLHRCAVPVSYDLSNGREVGGSGSVVVSYSLPMFGPYNPATPRLWCLMSLCSSIFRVPASLSIAHRSGSFQHYLASILQHSRAKISATQSSKALDEGHTRLRITSTVAAHLMAQLAASLLSAGGGRAGVVSFLPSSSVQSCAPDEIVTEVLDDTEIDLLGIGSQFEGLSHTPHSVGSSLARHAMLRLLRCRR